MTRREAWQVSKQMARAQGSTWWAHVWSNGNVHIPGLRSKCGHWEVQRSESDTSRKLMVRRISEAGEIRACDFFKTVDEGVGELRERRVLERA